ncbi:MAG: hypothetical protein ABR543_02410 [Gemmatimonadaceae bacterium]
MTTDKPTSMEVRTDRFTRAFVIGFALLEAFLIVVALVYQANR